MGLVIMNDEEVANKFERLEQKIEDNTIQVAKLVERCKWFMILITALCGTVYGISFNIIN